MVYTILIHIIITVFGNEVRIITFIRVHEARTEVAEQRLFGALEAKHIRTASIASFLFRMAPG